MLFWHRTPIDTCNKIFLDRKNSVVVKSILEIDSNFQLEIVRIVKVCVVLVFKTRGIEPSHLL